jgi:osmoprotectant transport system substrate-binding protein/osmoprotectant transport system permease protein
VSEQLALLPQYLLAHLQLTLLALALGIGFSVPLGIALTRRPSLERTVVGIASVIQTIPSLALLAIMVPVLGALGLTGIGYLPAIIALTLYSILPVLRNTVTGIGQVNPALIEAARGVGMTDRQMLMKVELPVALPVIVAGIRTATVWTVGMATLSTPVGAPSLGNYIFSGLQTRNYASVMVGCVAAAVLALVLDSLVRSVEVGLRNRRRALLRGSLALLAILCLGTAASALPGLSGSAARKPVTIGAKTFTEQYILGDILADEIKRQTGARTEVIQSLGSTVAFDALRSGGIDAYVEYSGTIWATLMKRSDAPKDRGEVLHEIERWLQEQHAGTVVGSLGFENTYALAIRGADARSLGIKTISDLAHHASRMKIGADYEFLQRPEWKALQQAYGLTFSSQRSMDPSLMYQALANGDVDVISAFSTDGRIAALDLSILVDDKSVIPPYDALILAGERLTRERPDIVAALRKLSGTIDPERMQAMNLSVDRDHRSAADVAAEFINSVGNANGPSP